MKVDRLHATIIESVTEETPEIHRHRLGMVWIIIHNKMDTGLRNEIYYQKAKLFRIQQNYYVYYIF